jgi:hypothetical protein
MRLKSGEPKDSFRPVDRCGDSGPRFRLRRCTFAGGPSRSPSAEDFFQAGDADLDVKALPVKTEDGVMAFVGGAAECSVDENDAEPKIDRGKHGRQDADVGLASRHDQSIDFPFCEKPEQPAAAERRVNHSVHHIRWRHE